MGVLEIRNQTLSVKVSTHGAEVISLTKGKSPHNWIWPAKPLWPRSAPHLFPIVGKLSQDLVSISGNEYNISQHGFARDLEFTVTRQSEDSVVFSLSSNEETLRKYPFTFILEVQYQLVENSLILTYYVRNTGGQRMPFSIGWHPGFVLPQQEALPISIKTEEDLGAYHLLDKSFLNLDSAYPAKSREVTIDKAFFDKDALIFLRSTAKKIQVCDQAGNSIEVRVGGAPYLGLWSKDPSQFICIEPWWGVADVKDSIGDIFHKLGIQTCEPNQAWSSQIQVDIF